MTESDFNKRLKTLSLIALKVIIKGTGLKTKSELLLWKFYIEGKSYYEIADDLGCDRFIKSSSITTTSTNLVITLSTTPTLTNLKRFCLVLAQSLPSGANTLPVQIQIGTTVYPVYTRTGNLLRADQIRCRRVYPIIFGSDPNHFSMLCCVPNTVYTPTAPTVPTVEVLED